MLRKKEAKEFHLNRLSRNTYKIFFTKKAEKDLNKLAKIDAKSTVEKIAKITLPFPPELDIKKIPAVPRFYRLRIRKIRAIFELDKDKKEIWIRKIKYRGGVYRF